MAKQKKGKSKSTTPKFDLSRLIHAMTKDTVKFCFGVFIFLTAGYFLIAMLSFLFSGGVDQSAMTLQGAALAAETKNSGGAWGAIVGQYFMNEGFGLASFFIVAYLAIVGMRLMGANKMPLISPFFHLFFLTVWVSTLLGVIGKHWFGSLFLYLGGLHGHNLAVFFEERIGIWGLCLLFLLTALIYVTCLTDKVQRFAARLFQDKMTGETTSSFATATDKNEEYDDTEDDNEYAQEEEGYLSLQPSPAPFPPQAATEEIFPASPAEEHGVEIELTNDDFVSSTASSTTATSTASPATSGLAGEDTNFEIEVMPVSEEDMRGDLSQPYNPRLDLENYRFPTIDLLKQDDNTTPAIDKEELHMNKDRIIQVLRSFGVEISTIKASVGPTVTLYEITPAEGQRISKIKNLQDDIALSLAALGIRIIAPMPGKGTIGIEVPNQNPHTVSMASILSSKRFIETTYELPVALGKTITNEVFMVDLAKAPHMLVAGATGQGKSVGLNAIVTSLLYKKHPSELKFVIVDPKKVEFAIYAPIEKHYLAKLPDGEDAIITDVTKVVQTLNSLCTEMDTRYDLLRQAGCRNIKEYNAKFIARQLNPQNGHKFMPYIVVIVDEFGDLIMTAGKEVELPICRIAQLARAVGIHAIIATQRPSTNIITGSIKANFPARVAFKSASMIDSRTILDRPGAEQLIGKGDLLYLQGSDTTRVQCAFMDTPEVERVVEHISHQQGYPSAFLLPEYVAEGDDSTSSDVDLTRLDGLFEEAARLIMYHQEGSTSLLQRKFSIGYNRAGRIMDQLEKAGIVGRANGSKPREVYCTSEDDLQMRINNLKGNL